MARGPFRRRISGVRCKNGPGGADFGPESPPSPDFTSLQALVMRAL
jgi:hypothetical protein